MSEAPSDPAAELKEAFLVFDKNGDGFVSRDEIRCILGKDITINETEIEDTLKTADKNGDGKIDIQGNQKTVKCLYLFSIFQNTLRTYMHIYSMCLK